MGLEKQEAEKEFKVIKQVDSSMKEIPSPAGHKQIKRAASREGFPEVPVFNSFWSFLALPVDGLSEQKSTTEDCSLPNKSSHQDSFIQVLF